MKKSIPHIFLICLSCFSLSAEEPSSEHTTVESRPLTTEQKQQMETSRKEEQTSHSRQSAPVKKQKKNVKGRISSQNHSFFSKRYIQPIHSHWLSSISMQGDSLELEDGSHWKIPSYQAQTVYSWQRGDLLTITPNHSFFSSYYYYINNACTGTSVPANLYIGPLAFTPPYTRWVVALDPIHCQVYLQDGSSWNIALSDASLLNQWAPNDTIIIGENDSWFSSYDTILINVNMNHYIRAKQF